MSHIPSSAMKHAHADAPAHATTPAAQVERLVPPLWTMVAAGIAGAVGTALVLSLRSSAPAKAAGPKRKRTKRKSADD